MEKIDRELLIREISCRLLYGIKAQVFGWDEEKGEIAIPLKVYSVNTDGYVSFEYNRYNVETVYIEDCLLYLRPMSDMTEEEYKEYSKLWDLQDEFPTDADIRFKTDVFDWLNAHHFDYRNLIERGLAIEVTEENNPYED